MVHNSTEVAQLVESGAADIGFLESPTVRSSLRRRRIGWDDLAVAVPTGHDWATRSEVTAEELAATPLLLREEGSGTRETVERALDRLGLEVSLGLVMASNTALRSAAVAGIGPVVLSELTLRTELASGQLVRIEVNDLPLRRPLSAVWRRAEILSVGAAALLAVVDPTRRRQPPSATR
jgi:DNA-binding transcriptional LysR family regulator